MVPSTLHQCLKVIRGKREILVPVSKAFFTQQEVFWAEATLFDDISDGPDETKPQRVLLHTTFNAIESFSNNMMKIDLVDLKESSLQ